MTIDVMPIFDFANLCEMLLKVLKGNLSVLLETTLLLKRIKSFLTKINFL